MKTSKILILLMLAVSALTFNSCKKCSGEQPRARIVNNGSKEANVQIKTSGGNTVNINNIGAGTASAFNSFAAGSTTFTITVDKANYVQTYSMEECFEYDIAIDGNNNITSTPIDRNE